MSFVVSSSPTFFSWRRSFSWSQLFEGVLWIQEISDHHLLCEILLRCCFPYLRQTQVPEVLLEQPKEGKNYWSLHSAGCRSLCCLWWSVYFLLQPMPLVQFARLLCQCFPSNLILDWLLLSWKCCLLLSSRQTSPSLFLHFFSANNLFSGRVHAVFSSAELSGLWMMLFWWQSLQWRHLIWNPPEHDWFFLPEKDGPSRWRSARLSLFLLFSYQQVAQIRSSSDPFVWLATPQHSRPGDLPV